MTAPHVDESESSSTPTVVLRSTGWDGPTPQPGDVLLDDEGNAARIVTVAEGPGCGQWRLETVRCSSFRWSARLDTST